MVAKIARLGIRSQGMTENAHHANVAEAVEIRHNFDRWATEFKSELQGIMASFNNMSDQGSVAFETIFSISDRFSEALKAKEEARLQRKLRDVSRLEERAVAVYLDLNECPPFQLLYHHLSTLQVAEFWQARWKANRAQFLSKYKGVIAIEKTCEVEPMDAWFKHLYTVIMSSIERIEIAPKAENKAMTRYVDDADVRALYQAPNKKESIADNARRALEQYTGIKPSLDRLWVYRGVLADRGNDYVLSAFANAPELPLLEPALPLTE